MFGNNITWYNKMNILSLRVITSMFQVWVLKQKAAIDGIILS